MQEGDLGVMRAREVGERELSRSVVKVKELMTLHERKRRWKRYIREGDHGVVSGRGGNSCPLSRRRNLGDHQTKVIIFPSCQ